MAVGIDMVETCLGLEHQHLVNKSKFVICACHICGHLEFLDLMVEVSESM